jgi:hypothetical protein
LEADHLKAFLYDLPVFERNLQKYNQRGNEVLFKALDSKLKELH